MEPSHTTSRKPSHSPLRLALVGVGDIGISAHLPAIARSPDAILAAIADVDPRALAAAARTVGSEVHVTTDANEVFHDAEIDGVVLATPPWVTAQLAPAALRAGKYVLAEKPLAPSSSAATRFSQLDSEAAARLQVGFTYRHHPSIERLRELVDSGALGNPLLIRISAFDRGTIPGSALGDLVLTHLEHGMPIVHEGAHFCDWLNLILGAAPAEISGMACRTDRAYPHANFNVATVRYDDGTVALLEAGWLAPALPPNYFTVTGARGHAVIDADTMSLTVTADGASEHLESSDNYHEQCFAIQLERFLIAIRNGEQPVPGLAAGLASLEFTDALVQNTVVATPAPEKQS